MEWKKFLSQTNSKDVNEIAPSNRRVSFNFIRENAAFTFLKNRKTLHIFNSKNNTTTNRTWGVRINWNICLEINIKMKEKILEFADNIIKRRKK